MQNKVVDLWISNALKSFGYAVLFTFLLLYILFLILFRAYGMMIPSPYINKTIYISPLNFCREHGNLSTIYSSDVHKGYQGLYWALITLVIFHFLKEVSLCTLFNDSCGLCLIYEVKNMGKKEKHGYRVVYTRKLTDFCLSVLPVIR